MGGGLTLAWRPKSKKFTLLYRIFSILAIYALFGYLYCEQLGTEKGTADQLKQGRA